MTDMPISPGASTPVTPSPDELNRLRDAALAAADAARRALAPFWRQGFRIEAKSDASLVTEADRAVEAAMVAVLRRLRPSDGIQGEEGATIAGSSGFVWHLDPIDGTSSFVIGRPSFTTLIAVEAVAGRQMVLGLIDQPVLAERWLAVAGAGLVFQERPVTRPAAAAVLAAARFGATVPFSRDPRESAGLAALAYASHTQVWGGDAYLYALLAQGGLDMVADPSMATHDWAALIPIVEAIGGRVTDWSGRPLHAGAARQNVLAAATPALHGQALAVLAAG